MKVDTQNCSWQDFTHSNYAKEILNRRLHVFTGKGGTGKTTLALSWTKFLQSKKKKVLFNNIGQNISKELIKNLKIPFLAIDSEECMKEYMARKLGSEIIAKWIMDTSFFKALFGVVPGLGYVTYLGYLVKMLEEDPKLHLVIDAEASGHAITMLESPFNFKEIFLSGLVIEDLDLIMKYFSSEEKSTIFTICNPTPMSVTENRELGNHLKELGITGIIPIINNSFHRFQSNDLPSFLKKKIKLEVQSIQEMNEEASVLISHLPEMNEAKIVKELAKDIGGSLQ